MRPVRLTVANARIMKEALESTGLKVFGGENAPYLWVKAPVSYTHLIGASEKADFSMRIFNADGSEAMMCGNASRCIGKYVYCLLYTSRCV